MLRAKPKELRWATLPKNTPLSSRAYKKLKTRMRVTGSRVKQNNWEGVTDSKGKIISWWQMTVFVKLIGDCAK